MPLLQPNPYAAAFAFLLKTLSTKETFWDLFFKMEIPLEMLSHIQAYYQRLFDTSVVTALESLLIWRKYGTILPDFRELFSKTGAPLNLLTADPTWPLSVFSLPGEIQQLEHRAMTNRTVADFAFGGKALPDVVRIIVDYGGAQSCLYCGYLSDGKVMHAPDCRMCNGCGYHANSADAKTCERCTVMLPSMIGWECRRCRVENTRNHLTCGYCMFCRCCDQSAHTCKSVMRYPNGPPYCLCCNLPVCKQPRQWKL